MDITMQVEDQNQVGNNTDNERDLLVCDICMEYYDNCFHTPT